MAPVLRGISLLLFLIGGVQAIQNDTCTESSSRTCNSQEYDTFHVEFKLPGQLGIRFEEKSQSIHVVEVVPGKQAHSLGTVSPGDQAVRVNDKSLEGLPLASAVHEIQTAPSPKVLHFRRRRTDRPPPPPAAPQSFTLELHQSGPLGISLLASLTVNEVLSGMAQQSGLLEPGDVLLSVNGQRFWDGRGKQLRDVDAAVATIAGAALPKVLEFRPAPASRARPPLTALGTRQAQPAPAVPEPVPEETGEAALTIHRPSILQGKATPGLRALFGPETGCAEGRLTTGVEKGRTTLSVGCSPWRSAFDGGASVAGSILLVKRGACSFGTKVSLAEAAGARGVVVVNEEGRQLIRMPASAAELAGHPLSIPAVMVDHSAGAGLQSLANSVPITASLGQDCATSADSGSASESDHPAGSQDWSTVTLPNGRTRDRRLVPQTATLLTWSQVAGEEGETRGILGYSALFGAALGQQEYSPAALVLAEGNQEACEPLSSPDVAYGGSLVAVKRGTCTFTTKAMHVQRAGGAGMVVVNNERGISSLYQMPGDPGEEELVKIPAIMISPSHFRLFEDALSSEGGSAIGRLSGKYDYYWCDLSTKKVCGVDDE